MSEMTIEQAYELALRHHRAGRLGEAERVCKQIVAQRPEFAEGLHLLGLIEHRLGRDDVAADFLRRAIAIRPDWAEAHYNLGVVLRGKGPAKEVIAAFTKAIALRPDVATAHSNLGSVLRDAGKLEEAVAAYRRAIGLDPNRAQHHANLGIALRESGRFDESIAAYRRAIALDANCVDAQWNLGVLLLTLGEFAEGWEKFEWRLLLTNPKLGRDFPQRFWNGDPMENGTLLVYTEGGAGDAIHFIRLISKARDRVGKLILECQAELSRLFEGLPGVDQMVVRGNPLPAFDSRISLFSLSRILGIRLENIPNAVPYLRAPRQDVERWRERILRDGKRNIGLRWAGSAAEPRNRTREIGVFAPLAGIAGLRFYSLQKGPEGNQPPPEGLELIDHTADLNDFADTAALIENLDLVISVDTSVAHLAGAMGKPVWVLIPYLSDFRWLLNRSDSPWYPTMRLFRQELGGDWESVVAQMAQALRA